MNDTAVAIALVMIPPMTENAVAKNPATAERIGASAVTIIVPSAENAPTIAVTMLEQAPAMTVPTAANADATILLTEFCSLRFALARMHIINDLMHAARNRRRFVFDGDLAVGLAAHEAFEVALEFAQGRFR